MTTPNAGANAIVLIYGTAPNTSVAETIATALLDQSLIACANLWPGMTALYRWKGEIARDQEIVMIFKTRADLADRAIAAARALHPYETPALVVIPASGGHGPFLDWVQAETAGNPA